MRKNESAEEQWKHTLSVSVNVLQVNSYYYYEGERERFFRLPHWPIQQQVVQLSNCSSRKCTHLLDIPRRKSFPSISFPSELVILYSCELN